MSKIKISVIVPLYKHNEEYVEQCLNSLYMQSLKEIEFILIDNGANDNNKKIIDKYCNLDNRFRKIILPENKGLGYALNKGIENSFGEYIGFLESDDYITENMYENLYKHNNNCDIVKSLFYGFFENKEPFIINNFKPKDFNRIIKGRGECPNLIQSHVSHWSGIYKKSFLENNNIKFNETAGGASQDFGFIIRCYAYANTVYVIDNAYIFYRLDSGNHNKRFLDKNIIKECMITLNDLIEDENIPSLVWDNIFKRIAFRFINVNPFTYREYLNMKNFLKKIEIKQNYQCFSKEEKKQIKKYIYYNKAKFLYKTLFNKLIYKNKLGNDHDIKILSGVIYVKKSYNTKEILLLNKIPMYKCKRIGIHNEYYIFNKKILSIMVKKRVKTYIEECKEKTYKDAFALLKVHELHSKVLPPYKNIYKDKSVVILGSGPSLNQYTPIPDTITIALNRSFLKEGIWADYIFAWDFPNLIKNDLQFYEKIKTHPAKKIFGKFISTKVPQISNSTIRNLDALPLFSSARHCILQNWIEPEIFYDIEKFPLMDFGSVAFGAFHFALYTGAKKIYLVGIDNSLNGYFTDKHTQQFLLTDQIYLGWLKVKDFIKEYYPETEVISINPVGLKGIFKDRYTQQYISENNIVVEENEILELNHEQSIR